MNRFVFDLLSAWYITRLWQQVVQAKMYYFRDRGGMGR